eukprot:GHVR01167790.1.p1 GENE.GHVR01167790.1~~GHVR01167790.1.p1  ORF type:complete len:292 (+),score=60.41 GHVR01167790.1:200-1075(+)
MHTECEGEGEIEKEVRGTFHIKLLIDKNNAGIVIGRQGTVISSIESSTSCSLQISPHVVVFPGTNSRVLLLHGTPHSCTLAASQVLNKIWAFNDVLNNASCRFAVSSAAASAIIGTKGQRIKTLQADTGAQVQVSERVSGIVERLVTVSGGSTNVLHAFDRIIDCIVDDTHMNMPVTRNIPTTIPPPAFMYPGDSSVAMHNCEIEMQVPDDITGFVLGKKGSFLQQLTQNTRAQVRVSLKGELLPGTVNRRFTISGPLLSVHSAHALLVQRIAEAKTDKDGRPKKAPILEQ